MAEPTVCRGSSDEYGSWKTIWTWRCSAGRSPGSTPATLIEPAAGGLEPDHATGQSRLARAGFANQANAFSLPDLEADAPEGFSRPAATVGEHLTQTDNPENCVWASRLRRLGDTRVVGERGGHGGQFVADFVKSDARRLSAWAHRDKPRAPGGTYIGRPLTARRKGTLARHRVGERHRPFDDRQGRNPVAHRWVGPQ